MPDELDDSQSTVDKPDTDLTPDQLNQSLLADLPADPAERANVLQERLVAEAKEKGRVAKENERLARERDEQRTRGDHWYEEAERRKQQLQSPTPDVKSAAKKDLKTPPKLDLAEVVADEETGYEKLATRLKEDFGLMTRDEFENERKAERTAAQRSTAIQEKLSQDYEDLSDPKSPLRKESLNQFLTLEQEHPDWDTEAIAELAVTRAARKIGYVPGKKKEGGEADDARDPGRGVFAPAGKRNSGPASGVVDDKLRRAAVKTAGEQLPQEVLQRVANTVAKNQREQARLHR